MKKILAFVFLLPLFFTPNISQAQVLSESERQAILSQIVILTQRVFELKAQLNLINAQKLAQEQPESKVSAREKARALADEVLGMRDEFESLQKELREKHTYCYFVGRKDGMHYNDRKKCSAVGKNEIITMYDTVLDPAGQAFKRQVDRLQAQIERKEQKIEELGFGFEIRGEGNRERVVLFEIF